ncbi:MAG: hypothetical protein RI996_114 [Candidatus Parcubacteria bacterium]|jgi:hypothetical protein
MSLKTLQHKHANTSEQYGYAGIPIFATVGIHENTFDIVQELHISKDAPILILGSGAGAFDKRMLDNGYTNITSIEFVEGVHQVKGVKLLHTDLNTDFSTLGTFKLIVALEIIEHLENEFHFMRQVALMLEDTTSYCIVSTPNAESSFARMKYALTGSLHWFGVNELSGTGHIHPVFDHIFRFNVSETGLSIQKKYNNKNIWFDSLFRYKKIHIRLAYMFVYVLSLFIANRDDSDIHIYLIKK